MKKISWGTRTIIILLTLPLTPTASAVSITWINDSFDSLVNVSANITEPHLSDAELFVGSNTEFGEYNFTGIAEARVGDLTQGQPLSTATGRSGQISGRLENVFGDRQGFYFVGSSHSLIASDHLNPGSLPTILAESLAVSSRIFEFQVDAPSRAIFSGSLGILEYDKATPDDTLYRNSVIFSFADSGALAQPLLYHELTGTNDGMSSLSMSGAAYLVPGVTYSLQAFTSSGGARNEPNDFRESVTTSLELYMDVVPVPLPSAFWLFGAGVMGLLGISKRNIAP